MYMCDGDEKMDLGDIGDSVVDMDGFLERWLNDTKERIKQREMTWKDQQKHTVHVKQGDLEYDYANTWRPDDPNPLEDFRTLDWILWHDYYIMCNENEEVFIYYQYWKAYTLAIDRKVGKMFIFKGLQGFGKNISVVDFFNTKIVGKDITIVLGKSGTNNSALQ